MALSVRNPEVETLARDLSTLTGRTMTEEILDSLRDRKARLAGKSEQQLSTILAIMADCARLPVLDARTADEILGYQENGAF